MENGMIGKFLFLARTGDADVEIDGHGIHLMTAGIQYKVKKMRAGLDPGLPKEEGR